MLYIRVIIYSELSDTGLKHLQVYTNVYRLVDKKYAGYLNVKFYEQNSLKFLVKLFYGVQ